MQTQSFLQPLARSSIWGHMTPLWPMHGARCPDLCAWGQGGHATEAELKTVVPNVLLELWGKEKVSLVTLGWLNSQDGSQEGGAARRPEFTDWKA